MKGPTIELHLRLFVLLDI